MEALFTEYHDDIFGEKQGKAFTDFTIYSMASSVVEGCLLDEFQRYAYENPDCTLEQLNTKYMELCLSLIHIYWTIAYGTQNGETNKCRTSVMYNMWDSCIRRCPQIGNGTGHIYNNYHVNNDGSINDGTSQIIPGEGSVIFSENCRFEGLKKVEAAIDKNAKYKDSGSYTSDTLTSEPYPLSNNLGSYTSHSWNPGNENYGYSLISA